jgi:hypothetical protein
MIKIATDRRDWVFKPDQTKEERKEEWEDADLKRVRFYKHNWLCPRAHLSPIGNPIGILYHEDPIFTRLEGLGTL